MELIVILKNMKEMGLKMNSKNLVLGYIKLSIVILIWGGVYHVAKFLTNGTDPFTLSFTRFFIASVILLILHHNCNGINGFKKTKNDWIVLFLIGFFGICLYNLFFFAAESLISANIVSIIYSLTPCITVYLGSIFLKQKIGVGGNIGVLVALIGAIGVISLSDGDCGKIFCSSLFRHISLGQTFSILASFCMAIYSILNKKASHMGISSLTITTFSSFFGMILLLIPFLIWGDAKSLLAKSWEFWLAMGYTSILSTVIAYKWYSDAIQEIGMGQTVVCQNGIPFATIIIGALFYNQGVSWGVFISGAVIVLGVIITNFSVNRYS